MGKTKITHEEKLIIINRYENGESIRKIALDSKISKTRINTILNDNNIKMKSKGNSYCIRKYTLDEHYFDVIDTEEKAYWLGMISADGHVSDEGITLGLKESDKELLELFLKSLSSDSVLHYKHATKSYSVTVYSKIMVDTLRGYGFYKDKSYTQTFPTVIPDSLLSHFVRGLFDGDGLFINEKKVWKKIYK